ncbi:acyltransferase domain-containing protein [Streptomyces sp. S1A(2023)]
MTLIHVFPGQGSHRPGIGKDLFPKFPHLVRQADSVLGRSITDLCLNASAKELTDTRNTQTAMYVVGALSYLDAVRETGQVPDAVAGHSLGEYVALFAAGAFDFLTGLEIVVRRGELMAQAPEGGMAAVMGVEPERIREVLARHAPGVDIANLNAPGQTVVAGPRDQIKGLNAAFGDEARTVVPLHVGGAFHSRYMADAAEEFGAFLATVPARSAAHRGGLERDGAAVRRRRTGWSADPADRVAGALDRERGVPARPSGTGIPGARARPGADGPRRPGQGGPPSAVPHRVTPRASESRGDHGSPHDADPGAGHSRRGRDVPARECR